MAELAAYKKQMLAVPDQQISLTDPDRRVDAVPGVVGYNVQVTIHAQQRALGNFCVSCTIRSPVWMMSPGVSKSRTCTVCNVSALASFDAAFWVACAGGAVAELIEVGPFYIKRDWRRAIATGEITRLIDAGLCLSTGPEHRHVTRSGCPANWRVRLRARAYPPQSDRKRRPASAWAASM